MPSRLVVRVAALVLALLVPLGGARATTATACCAADCEEPCCAHDACHASVVPVLPCCHVVTVERAAPQPTPSTVEKDQRGLACAPPLVSPSLTPLLHDLAPAPPRPRPLAAPPLYQQHCALLL